ncbi:MAG: NYN domain-containing protein, partial [Xanthobacteraceae bacterium]
MTRPSGMPGRDCPRCPRLVAFRNDWREREPQWFNAPVDSFGALDARLLIVGLAPGLRGANLYATAKSLGFDIDYKRLLREFQSRGYLVRAFYYTAVIEDQEYSSIRPLIDWLDYNGYTVVTKATKEFVDQTGRRKVKGNMDIELAVDAMELAPHIDQMVLFS